MCIHTSFEKCVDESAYRDETDTLCDLGQCGGETVEPGLRGPWRPQPARLQYASNLDRYNSMKIDVIDAGIDAFEGCGRVDHRYVAIRMQHLPVAIVTPNTAQHRPN